LVLKPLHRFACLWENGVVGTLYLVATPIGNLEDITVRALRVLFAVDYVLCEDTRETGKLLRMYQSKFKSKSRLGGGDRIGGEIGWDCFPSTALRADLPHNDREDRGVVGFPKLVSYTDYNREKRIPWVIEQLKLGKDVALVADRGTPLISDPGYKLVQEVLGLNTGRPRSVSISRSGIGVIAVPGANAVLTALVMSGLPPDKFMFVGFLPKKTAARRKLFKSLPEVTIVAYEAPYRLLSSLKDLRETLGEVEAVVCVELTKMHEQVYRGKVSEVLEMLDKGKVKGEVTVVFGKR
jgi:16S rRNA (cytidine1402-2'-O)-methyltransferase